MKVLLAEDDPITNRVLTSALKMRGHEVTSVTNGRDAWAAYQQHGFRFVVLDLKMPELDGWEICQRIRASPRGDGVCVLVITASTQGKDVRDVLAAGATDYLAKPFDLGALDARFKVAEHHAEEVKKREAAEAALRESEERYRSVVSALSEGILVLNEDGTTQACNASAERIFGLTGDQIRGRSLLDPQWHAIHEDGAAFSGEKHPAMITLQTGKAQFNVIMGIHKPDGTPVWISINSQPLIHQGEERPYAAVISFKDITDQRRLEEHLRKAQKMEAVGQLAGGVAHDFNNIIGIIQGYTDLILRKLSPTDPLRGRIETIRSAAKRGIQITRQLLAFSRRQLLQPKVLDLNAHLRNIDDMIRSSTGDNIELIHSLGASSSFIKVDPTYLDQVILNLVLNARDAMPEGGKLTIETSVVELHEEYCKAHSGVSPGSYVMIAVRDTGIGMTQEVQASIFEPFFTTKRSSKGSGLGLSTVYGIVRQSGGHIEFHSQPGMGTAFMVYFPHAKKTSNDMVSSHETQSTPRGTETILVVEDEEKLRMVAVEMLMGQGYHVLQAAHGSEALQKFHGHSDSIQLLFTDLVMPGMDGVELAGRFRALRPDTKVLFTSGYAEQSTLRRGLLNPEINFLAKPYDLSGLARKMREILDQKDNLGAVPDKTMGLGKTGVSPKIVRPPHRKIKGRSSKK